MRQLLIVSESGTVWADVMLDVREMSTADLERRRGWTFTLAQARGLARDLATLERCDVHLVEMIGRPDRTSDCGRRRYRAQMHCRVLHVERGRVAA